VNGGAGIPGTGLRARAPGPPVGLGGVEIQPAGATVRRLQRERGGLPGLAGARPVGRPARRVAPPPGRGATEAVAAGAPAAGGDPAPRPGAPAPRPRGVFPLRLTHVLDLHRHGELLVLDGRLGRLEPGRPESGDTAVEWHRCGRRRLRFGETVEERLVTAIRLALPRLRNWALSATSASAYTHLDGTGPPPARGPVHQVEQFLWQRLIPHLKAQGHGCRPGDPAPAPTALAAGVVDSLGRRFAVSDGRWHELIPFWGRPPEGGFTVVVAGHQYLGLRTMAQGAVIKRAEAALGDAALAAFPRGHGRPSPSDLYRDEVYAVVCTPGGRYYACQRIPPYAVEDMDGSLYYFEGAEFGIQVAATSATKVLRPVCVQLMHPYRHMFVGHIDGGAFECIPRPSSYFKELAVMPLEEALLHHLEAARQTLCAGYTPDSAPWHPLDCLGRRRLSAAAARQQGLPVYWFPRRQGRAAPRRRRR